MTKPSISSATQRRGPVRNRPAPMALEQRLMFDAAGVIDVTRAAFAVVDAAAPDTATADQPPADATAAQAAALPEAIASEAPAAAERREVAFVDTSVAGYQTLVAGIRPGVEVVLIDTQGSALTQMAAWAQSHSGYDAIHVLSHGAEGQLQLGRDSLTAANVGHASLLAELQQLGRALTADGDLLLYGCNVADGETGQAFLRQLAEATGADVAGSIDATGAAALGGNWTLEQRTGATIDALQVASFDNLLANPSLAVTSLSSSTANGVHGVGSTIVVQVNFSEPVYVTGTPRLTLETGKTDLTVNYSGGSGTSTLNFNYTVRAGDSSADLDVISSAALSLNGGTIKDDAGNDAPLTLPAPGTAGSLGANKALVIDGVAPTVTSTAVQGSPAVNASTLTYTVQFSETVTGVDVSDFQLTATGNAGGTIASVSGSGSSYSVVVNNVVGTGTLRLDLKTGANGITDAAANTVTSGYTAGSAFAVDHRSVFDANEQAFSFGGTPTRIAGAGTNVGTSFLYSNVITIGGQQIDAIVTLTALSNATLSSFDSTTNPYANAAYFQPNVNVSTAGGYALFDFAFIKGGSYNATTAPAGTAVLLRNVLLNTYDLDGAGANANGRQFTDISGIGGYTVSSTSQLATPSDLGGGVTRFATAVGGNITSAPGTVAGDNIRARVSFDAVSQTTIKVGDLGATGVAYFGLDFSPGPTFTNARTVDVVIAGGPVTTGESGTTGSFTVALTSAPAANVTVSLTGLNVGEGRLSTSTLTFTTANWNTPQTVTVTGVDDAAIDGNISYTLTATTSSVDTSFNGRTAMVTVTNLDNDIPNAAPVVGNLGGDAATFTEGGSPVRLDSGSNATVTDTDSPNFATGTLTAAIVANGNTGEDVLAVMNQGTGAGQIGVSGNTISYGGTAIGTFSGGSGGSSLVVSFNSNATPAAAQALIRALTYANSDTSDPSTTRRTVRITLTDGDGGTSSAADVAVTVVAVNDAPVNSVPGAQTLVQDGSLVFSSANGNAISVADVDAGSGIIRVTLTATSGTLTLLGTSNLSFLTGNGSGNASMAFEGTQAAINAALAGMTYTPTPGYNGAAQISITTNDRGLSGTGGVLTDTDTINLTVQRGTPLVTTVSSSSADGRYGIGDTITLTVNFDQPVVVNTTGGTPTLQLETGTIDRSATYLSGSGTSTLSFLYVVQAGDLNGDLDFTSTSALSLGGGTIQGLSGSAAVLALPSVGGAASIAGQNALVVDGVRPSASIVVADSNLAAGETSLVTITFSEPVTGLSNADLTVANGMLSPVSSADGGSTWTATFTPNVDVEDSSNLITLDNTGVQDAAGNTGTGSTDSNQYAIDTRRPTIALSSSRTALRSGQTAVIGFTLSEASIDFGADDVTVVGGTLSGFSGAGTSYSATFTPDAGSTSTATLHVASSRFSDSAGNANTDGSDANNQLTLATNVLGPVVTGGQQFTYPENRSAGALLGTVTTDAPVAVVAFEISGGNSSGYFAIDASGRITLTGAGAAALSPANDHEIGPNTFTLLVRARDGAGEWSAPETVLLQLSDLNDNTPVANADSASTLEDTAITVDVLANDSDADGDALVIRSASVAPEQGTVAIVGGRLVFTPAADFNGTATIIYVASDGTNDSTPATLTIRVEPVDDTVVLAPVTQTVAEDSVASGNLLASASNGGTALQVAHFQIAGGGTLYTAGQTATLPGIGTLAISPDGSYTFTPAANWNGSAPVVTFTTNTGAGSTLNLQVLPLADAVQVSNPVVNEASPYAVFSVTGVAGEVLQLQLAGASADGTGTDFGAADATNLEVSLDGGATWQPYAGSVLMPAGGGLLARTPVIDDGLRDNNETFNLIATPAGGVATTGTATIKDDGTGSIFAANGQVDANALPSDDRLVSVSSPVVNEASPFAVFTVAGNAGQRLTLQLAGASADGSGTDFGAVDATNLEVSLDGGATWQPYAGSLLVPEGGSLLARTPVIDDSLRDNNETFNLTATPAGGVATTGTATIRDDGTGSIFAANGQVDANALPSDDRVVSVSSPVVNEASPFAVFTVAGNAGQRLTLQLAGASADGTGTDFGAVDATNLEVSLDGGATWQPYAGSVLVPEGGSLLARTPVIDDSLRDNNETFNLIATPAGGVATTGTTTIKDDGTGSIFAANGQVDANAQPSDDRLVSVSNPVVNEASPFAVFTVAGSAGQRLTLQLAGASADGSGTDFGAANASNLEVSLDGGATWQPYAGSVLVPEGGSLLARTPVIDDSLRDNNETFNLTATPAGGVATTGTATIKDDGTGSIFAANGQIDANALPSDDRLVSVSSPVVNEASPFAVFTVAGSAGQRLSLQLAGASASAGGTDFGVANATGLEVSLDGGATWQPYAGSVLIPDGGSLLARTPVIDDGVQDNGETFNLIATPAGGVATTGTVTIKDDGSGSIFGADGQIDTAAQPTDDTPLRVSSPEVNEASPFAVFTVTVNGEPGQRLALQLDGGSATLGDDVTAALEYFDGSTWQPVTDLVTMTGKTLLVRAAVNNDGRYEGAEQFALRATLEDGHSVAGTATLRDDGVGQVFNDRGQVVASAGDDDRPRPVFQPQTTAPAAPVATPMVLDPPVAPAGDWVWLPPVLNPDSPVSGGEAHALMVGERTPDQFFSLNTNVRFPLPIGLFKATQPTEQLMLSVELADGRPLPPWLSFKPDSRTFEGMPPAGLRGELRIKVSARDTAGNQADTMFRLHIGEEDESIKQATPEKQTKPAQVADPQQPARKTDRPGRAGLQQQLKDLAPPRRTVTDLPRDLPREQPRTPPSTKA